MIDCLQISHLINIIIRQQSIFFLKSWYSLCICIVFLFFVFFLTFNYILPQTSNVHVYLRLAFKTYSNVAKH